MFKTQNVFLQNSNVFVKTEFCHQVRTIQVEGLINCVSKLMAKFLQLSWNELEVCILC